MQAAGYSRGLEPPPAAGGGAAGVAAAAAAGYGLGEDDFLFYSTDDESAAFLDAPPATAAAPAPGDAAFVSAGHFGLPDPAAAGVFLATKTITLDGRSWGCGLDDDIALEEETAQWLDKDASEDDSGNELEPEDLEKFLNSALSPEPDEQDHQLDKNKIQKADTENAKARISANTDPDNKEEQRDRGKGQVGVNSQRTKLDSGRKLSSDASVLEELETIVSKLDSRSIFCLRDAFYRLADNAARRCGVHADATDLQRLSASIPLVHRRPEASTNSIDRSVASLLFRKEFPPPPLPLPPPSPPRPTTSPPPPPRRLPAPKPLLITASNTASSSYVIPIPKKQPPPQHHRHQQQQQHQQNQTFLNGKKIPLPPVHKHRCPGASNVTRTATTLRASPAAIPAAMNSSSLSGSGKNLLLIPTSMATMKRRMPLATTSTSNVYHHKRAKHHHHHL